MGKERSDLGFGDELEQFNPAEWAPVKRKTANDRLIKEAAQQAAQETGFQSRERSASPPPARVRRRRTGRNAQFNIKAKPETIEAFCAVADAQGWGLGETLEHAVALLEREYAKHP